MNSCNNENCLSSEESPARDNIKRRPLAPLYIQNNFVTNLPFGFKSPHLTYVQGGQENQSTATPNCNSSSATLTAKYTPCYSDKPQTTNYSSTPVKLSEIAEKEQYSYLTPVSSKASPSSASLPAKYTPSYVTATQCYSDKPQTNYSSTPVKLSEIVDKNQYSYLTPLSSKPGYPRALHKKENAACFNTKSRVYNPFDRYPEQFGFPVVSPSMFKEVVSPSGPDGSKFSWAIDHIAILHPASIESSPYSQAEMTTDPDFEMKAQEAIDRFFSQTTLPSPWTNSPNRPANLIPITSSSTEIKPLDVKSPILESPNVLSKFGCHQSPTQKVKMQNVWTQSEITFPAILPKKVEDAIAPFCTFTKDQTFQEEEECPSLNSTSLRRKLLFDKADVSGLATKKLNNSQEAQEICHRSMQSVSQIPFDESEDESLPWDTSMVPLRSDLRQCKLCRDINCLICVHITPIKMRSSSTGKNIISPNLSLISWGSPSGRGAEAAAIIFQSPNVSPIEKWSKRTRKRNHSEEILSSTTAANCVEAVNNKPLQCSHSSGNSPLAFPVDSSPMKIDTEAHFSSSLISSPTSIRGNIIDEDSTHCKMSDSLPFSPISCSRSNSVPSDQTFVTFINEDSRENKFSYLNDESSDLTGQTNNAKNHEATLDSGMVNLDGCSIKINKDLATLSNESHSTFMDVDSQRFENIFNNEISHGQDTGYQTSSFQPSYCSGNEQRNDSIEKELMKAKVNEKFPTIFGSFNFHTEN